MTKSIRAMLLQQIEAAGGKIWIITVAAVVRPWRIMVGNTCDDKSPLHDGQKAYQFDSGAAAWFFLHSILEGS